MKVILQLSIFDMELRLAAHWQQFKMKPSSESNHNFPTFGTYVYLLGLVLLLIGKTTELHSQVRSHWDTILYSGGNYPEILELQNSYLTMVRGDSTHELQIWEVDFSGKVIDSNRIYFGSFIQNCGECLISTNSNSFFYAHTSFFGQEDAAIQFVKFDSNWDTIKTRTYRFNDSITAKIHELQFIDNKLYYTGYVYLKPNRYQLLLACMDTSFNLIWEKQFLRNFVPGGYWGFDLEQTSDGGFMVSGINTGFPITNLNEGFLLKTDSAGNEQWRKTLKYLSGIIARPLQIEKRSDGNMIYCGSQDISKGHYLEQLRFGVITDSGNILLDTLIGKQINQFGAISMKKTLDGKYVIVGGTNHNAIQGMAFKFDERGKSIWQRYYSTGEKGEQSTFYTVTPSRDTGVVFAGTYFDNFNNHGTKFFYHWIMKVDKHGCLTPNCHNVNLIEFPINGDAIEVYPNPTNGKVNIKPLGCTPFHVKAYALDGRLLAESSQSTSIVIPHEYQGTVIIEVYCDAFIIRKLVLKK